MVQTERETGALRGQFARQVTVQASAAAQAESARAQAEQLSRKLAILQIGRASCRERV